MSALTELQSKWQVRIDTISDDLIKAEAQYLLEQYVAALPQQAALEANQISSYSIGGRSFSRRGVGEGQSMLRNLRLALWRYCYGTTSLMDANEDDISE